MHQKLDMICPSYISVNERIRLNIMMIHVPKTNVLRTFLFLMILLTSSFIYSLVSPSLSIKLNDATCFTVVSFCRESSVHSNRCWIVLFDGRYNEIAAKVQNTDWSKGE